MPRSSDLMAATKACGFVSYVARLVRAVQAPVLLDSRHLICTRPAFSSACAAESDSFEPSAIRAEIWSGTFAGALRDNVLPAESGDENADHPYCAAIGTDFVTAPSAVAVASKTPTGLRAVIWGAVARAFA